jgi:hypothetical protein
VQKDIVLWCNPTEKRTSATQRSDSTAYQLICGMDHKDVGANFEIAYVLLSDDFSIPRSRPYNDLSDELFSAVHH